MLDFIICHEDLANVKKCVYFLNVDFRDASKNYDGLSAKEASDEQTAPSEKKKRGKKVKLNGKELAVFFYKESAYAIDEKCPHLGKFCLA